MDVVLLGAHAATFTDFDGHSPADHVPRGKVLHAGGITLHEALAFGIGEIAALAPGTFGDQAAGTVNASGVELNKLHVLERQTGPQGHTAAVAGAGMGAGGREIGAAITARGQDHQLGLETVQGAVIQLPGGNAPADAFVHDQVEAEILDEELSVLGQGLAIHGVQHGVTSAVSGGAGTLDRRFTEIAGHAAKGALIDLTIGGAGEGDAPVLELINRCWRIAAEVFDSVLVA